MHLAHSLAAAATAIATTLSNPPTHIAPTRPLQYTESSQGLGSPQWDGGRTIIRFADLNADGHGDIVTVGDHGSPFVNTNMAGITVWFGNGRGQWLSRQTGHFGYGGVAVGDVNNDGHLDVGFGVHHDWGNNGFGDRVMGVGLGDGTGQNWTPWDQGLGVNGQSWGMFGTEFLDINLDGLLDIASISFGCCDGFHAYLNGGDGTWQHTFGFGGGNSSMDTATGDVDNDGWPDLAVAHQSGTVWLNDHNGGFVLNDQGLPPIGNLGRRGVSLGDISNEGFDDLAFVDSDGTVQVFWWAPGSGRWVPARGSLPTGGDFEVTRLLDMDGDGWRDLVAFGNGRLAIWLNDRNGDWIGAATFTVPNPGDYAGLAVGDVTHNGRPDIAIVSDQGRIFNTRNKLQFFKERSPNNRVSMRITSPPKYRTIRRGGVLMIDWLSAVPAGVSSTVQIEQSISGIDGPWTTLATDLPNNGRYQTIADGNEQSGDVWLRATVTAGSHRAQHLHGPFTLIDP